MNIRRLPLSGICLLSMMISGGCDSAATLIPVTGKVTVGTSTLKTGTVTFYPDAKKGNELTALPSAEIAEDGTYKLFTDGGEGAPEGWYRVTVVAQKGASDSGEELNEDAYAIPKYLVPEEFMSSDSTPLEVEVKPDGNFDLELPPTAG